MVLLASIQRPTDEREEHHRQELGHELANPRLVPWPQVAFVEQSVLMRLRFRFDRIVRGGHRKTLRCSDREGEQTTLLSS